ncbi:nucleoside hydrolase [Paenibacillus piri]|uniref:nucleoside hydrolase n=1 Tax=Paenibacillus piri TaxID=2547395 RepID=UPI001404C765|nr:nucleoside hydrolase [Paenibacillus piri]
MYNQGLKEGAEMKPVQLILDTDMLTDCDDTAALGMLHAMADAGEVDILATVVSSRYPMSAPVVDVINTYYNRPELPVGAPKNGAGAFRDDSSFLDKLAAEFPHRLASNEEAPDAVEVYRRVLEQAESGSVKILTIGYMSNLENLLKSGPDAISPLRGLELIERKVSEWVCMGGNFPVDVAKDNVNFTRDASAAVYTIRNWPGRITFAGREIGHNIKVGEALRQTPDDNPVRRAYQLHRDRFDLGHWNHHTADPSAVLYAVRGLWDYWELEADGYIDIQDDCSFVWRKKPGRNQGYLLQKMDRAEMGAIMEELIVRPPAGKPYREAIN